jgi:hypothetical protein
LQDVQIDADGVIGASERETRVSTHSAPKWWYRDRAQ